jgi:hypothetical protein
VERSPWRLDAFAGRSVQPVESRRFESPIPLLQPGTALRYLKFWFTFLTCGTYPEYLANSSDGRLGTSLR